MFYFYLSRAQTLHFAPPFNSPINSLFCLMRAGLFEASLLRASPY
jgi:hypothetical protein